MFKNDREGKTLFLTEKETFKTMGMCWRTLSRDIEAETETTQRITVPEEGWFGQPKYSTSL